MKKKNTGFATLNLLVESRVHKHTHRHTQTYVVFLGIASFDTGEPSS